MFRRKKWRYLILDEAHMIKNWKSQRWQTLLRFNSKRRLLITGTPLQVGGGGGGGRVAEGGCGAGGEAGAPPTRRGPRGPCHAEPTST
jgi:hypothetical protein